MDRHRCKLRGAHTFMERTTSGQIYHDAWRGGPTRTERCPLPALGLINVHSTHNSYYEFITSANSLADYYHTDASAKSVERAIAEPKRARARSLLSLSATTSGRVVLGLYLLFKPYNTWIPEIASVPSTQDGPTFFEHTFQSNSLALTRTL